MSPMLLLIAFLPAIVLGGLSLVLLVAYVADPGRPVTSGWSAGQLAAIPRPAGRHRAAGERAADNVGRPGWAGAHAEDGIEESIRSVTMELPVIERARCLAWTRGIMYRPSYPTPRRLRLVQLELARRLRASGVPTALRPRLGVCPA